MSTPISRPAEAAAELLWKHPDKAPADAMVACAEHETCVLTRDGAIFKVLGPGQHHVHAPSYAIIEAFFINASAVVKFGTIARMRDGVSGKPVGMRCFGEVRLRVVDPAKLCADAMGGGDGLTEYVKNKIAKAVSEQTARHAASGVLAFIADPSQTERVLAAVVQDLASAGLGFGGVEVAGFGNVSISPSAEDLQALGGTVPAPQPAAAAQQVAPPGAGAQFAIGSRVWGYWTDGNWYPAIVKQFENGQYLIDWEGNPDTTWLPATHLKPAG